MPPPASGSAASLAAVPSTCPRLDHQAVVGSAAETAIVAETAVMAAASVVPDLVLALVLDPAVVPDLAVAQDLVAVRALRTSAELESDLVEL